MKRPHLTLLVAAAMLLTGGFLPGQAQPNASSKAGAAPAQKLVRVATLKTVEANREFQSNVQLLRAQRDAMVELTTMVEKEKDAGKKKELKAQLDQLTATLNANNEKAQKLYGFSLARNYTMEIEVSHVYMIVTEDEAARIEQAQKAENAKKAETSGKKKK